MGAAQETVAVASRLGFAFWALGARLVVSSKAEMAAITQQGRNFDVSCRCCCCSCLAYISSTLMIRKQFDEQRGQQRGGGGRQEVKWQHKAKPSQVGNVPGCLARINIVISMKITISTVWTRLLCCVAMSLAACHLPLGIEAFCNLHLIRGFCAAKIAARQRKLRLACLPRGCPFT